MLFISSANTPAAFTKALVSNSSPFASITLYPFSNFSIFSTLVSVITSTPFNAAFSNIFIVTSQGPVTPAVGAYNAATTSLLTFGSIANTSSFSIILILGIPFFNPLLYSKVKCALSSSENAKTNEPVLLNGASISLHKSSYIAFPNALYFAIKVPSGASYPACTIPELALLVPLETSCSFSNTFTFKSYFANS